MKFSGKPTGPERAKALGTKGTLVAMIMMAVMVLMIIDDNGDGVDDEGEG